jgi:nitrate reductase NapE
MMVEENVAHNRKRGELCGFFFLTVIFAPALAVAIVGGFGFLIWMYQLVQGPPTY